MKAFWANKNTGPSAPASPAAGTGLLQRKCGSCGNHTVAGNKCQSCEDQEGLLQRSASNGVSSAQVPAVVGEVLRSPGRPLDAGTRSFFEPRFARSFAQVPVSSAAAQISTSSLTIGEPSSIFEHEADRMADAVTSGSNGADQNAGPSPSKNAGNNFDLSSVRIHTGPKAAESARAVGARAYTVGSDIVFGEGQYNPATESGRHLLSHEITHTLQQRGNAVSLQRSCVASVCPPVLVPVDALFPRYEAAERCIQTLYAGSHPAKQGISLSYNNEWQYLAGGRPQEKMALACLQGSQGGGSNFTAKGGMVAAAPDIWDFLSQTMYEITTASGSAFRVGKLGAEIALANSICGPMECGGLTFDRGTWSPPSGCFALGGDLYFTAVNTQGVIVYSMFKDGTKELALAALLAAMAAMMKSMGPKAGGTAIAKGAGGKLVPAYAIASLTAMALLLASGRAEAKLGPGDEEPLVSLFKELEKKGTKVPPEIQQMLDANPDLKKKMNDAMAKGGDPSAALEEINKQILDTIAANKDQFTPEELESLLAGTQEAGKALPKGSMTVQELKKLAEAARAGKTGDGSGTGGTGTAGTKPATDKPAADKPAAAEQTDKPKDTPKGDTGGKDNTPPAITQETRDKLSKSPKPVVELYQALLGKGPDSQKPNDDHLKRFLSMMPPGLTSEKVAELLKKRKPVTGETADQILDSLQAAINELDKTPAPPEGESAGEAGDKAGVSTAATPQPPPRPNATATIGPTVDGGGMKTSPEQLIKDLAARAKKAQFKNVTAGTYVVNWKIPAEDKGKLAAGSIISGELQGLRPTGEKYVGRIEAEITKVEGKNLTIKFITATPMVSAGGEVIFKPDHFLGRVDSVTLLDPPKKKKK